MQRTKPGCQNMSVSRELCWLDFCCLIVREGLLQAPVDCMFFDKSRLPVASPVEGQYSVLGHMYLIYLPLRSEVWKCM